MKPLSDQVKKVSSILDKLAGLCIFSVMLLIVANIVLRTVFSQPILGTYELVGFLTALGVAFALAHCAFQEGHIAVSFIIERFPRKIQSLTEVLVNITSLLLWASAAWAMVNFAQAMQLKKLVSPSAEIPVYPFIYLVALGLMGLCLVLLVKSYHSFRKAFGIGTAKKVAR